MVVDPSVVMVRGRGRVRLEATACLVTEFTRLP
jgi:hypothetical protein